MRKCTSLTFFFFFFSALERQTRFITNSCLRVHRQIFATMWIYERVNNYRAVLIHTLIVHPATASTCRNISVRACVHFFFPARSPANKTAASLHRDYDEVTWCIIFRYLTCSCECFTRGKERKEKTARTHSILSREKHYIRAGKLH